MELFSAEVYYLTKLPAVLVWSDVIMVCMMAVTLSIIASFFPSRTASKLDPIEALRE
jgi:lipoprotein-releasing system permease protein